MAPDEKNIPRWVGLGAPLAALLGWAALRLGPTHAVLALELSLVAGAVLALASLRLAPGAGSLPLQSAPRQAWEPWFFLALLVASAWARFHALDSIPAGAGGAEGEIAGRSVSLMHGEAYQAYVMDDDINWGTLTYYLGGFFAQHLGWTAGSFRLASACWGLVSVAALWVVARQISSPVAAAGAALLYSALNIHLVYSRQFFPSMVLTVSPVLGLGLYIEGWRRVRRRWPWFLAAGAMAALALHGYTPGRVVPGVFLAWFLCLAILQPPAFAGGAAMAWFWAGFLLLASPVLLWALRHPDGYMGLMEHKNAYGGHGLGGYLRGIFNGLPPYLKMWTISGDPTLVEGLPGRPVLEPLAGLLVPASVAFALFLMLRPLPLFLLGSLVAGLLPAMLGGGFIHPTTRRTILAFPAVFLMLALGLEQLRLGAWALGRRAGVVIFAVALLGAGAWSVADGWHRYFHDFMGDPRVQGDYGKRLYLWAKAVRSAGARRIVAEQGTVGYVANGILFSPDQAMRCSQDQEDILALPEGVDYRIGLDPYAQTLLPWLQIVLPGASAQLFNETGTVENNYSDPFAPLSYGAYLDVPASAVDALHLLRLAGGGKPLDPFSVGFGRAWEGRKVSLRGALLVPPSHSPLSAVCDWPGVTVRVAGLVVGRRPVELPCYGLLPLEIVVSVPHGAAGALPLRLLLDGNDLVAQGRVSGMDLRHGLWASYYAGAEPHPGERPVGQRVEPVAVMRYYDNPYFSAPFRVHWSALFRPADDGDYDFSVPGLRMRLRLEGRTVLERVQGWGPAVGAPVHLQAGRPVRLDLEAVVDGGAPARTIELLARGPHDTSLVPLDPQSLTPVR